MRREKAPGHAGSDRPPGRLIARPVRRGCGSAACSGARRCRRGSRGAEPGPARHRTPSAWGHFPQVQADLREHGLPRAGVQPRDRHQSTRQLIPQAARLIRGGMLAVREGFVRAVAWRHVVVPHGRHGVQGPGDCRIALAYLGRIHVIQGQRLRQVKDMFSPIMPGQRLSDGLRPVHTARPDSAPGGRGPARPPRSHG